MTDDIINNLLPFIHDGMRMPAGLIMDAVEEIERLKAENGQLRREIALLRPEHHLPASEFPVTWKPFNPRQNHEDTHVANSDA